jgi:sugar lactone lactonase YvrE
VGKVVMEMVRVNHLRNCLLCHSASLKDDDKVRGFVPPTNRPLPPAFTREYYAPKQQGTFVRADVTYLKQDFSVPLPVKNHGVWPAVQRFDFLVRERPATPKELAEAKKAAGAATEHQKSVFFALRELTGKDPGPTAEDWKRTFVKGAFEARTLWAGFKAARALAVDGEGRAYVRDGARIFTQEGKAPPAGWLDDPGEAAGLALDGKGHLLAALSRKGTIARIGLASKEVKPLAARHDGRRFNGPRRLVADKGGGVYFSDDPAPDNRRDTGSVYYLSAHGTVTRTPVALPRPRGLGLSPDGKTLYVVSPASADLMAYAVESAGSLGKGRVLCRLASAGADLAVDARGLICVLSAAGRSVELISPAGAKLGSARLPGVPVAGAVGGPERQTLYVLLKTALLAVDLSSADATAVVSR